MMMIMMISMILGDTYDGGDDDHNDWYDYCIVGKTYR